MVDTNVVIYAMRMHRKDDDDLLVEMTTDSVAALRSLDVLVVSAVTVTEIMRGMRPDELERNDIQAVLSSWTVLSLDAPAAAFAAELLSKRGEAEKTCRGDANRCEDHKCPLCGNAVPASKRIGAPDGAPTIPGIPGGCGEPHAVTRAGIRRAARAIPHLKSMVKAIRRKDRAAAVESGTAALAEM